MDTPGDNYLLRLANEYRKAGISVIPLQLDGSKAPASRLLPQVCDARTRKQSGTWLPYSKRIAELSELEHWFCRPAGIGMVCGAVSDEAAKRGKVQDNYYEGESK
jgi:putative DNA primase/helicase